MAACKPCETLMGQATTVEPHEALVTESVRFHDTGELERLRCRSCESKWERFTPNDRYSGQCPAWKMLGPAGSRRVDV
jgi:hypothetical protein